MQEFINRVAVATGPMRDRSNDTVDLILICVAKGHLSNEPVNRFLFNERLSLCD